jgi:hypothetical protein
MMTDLPLVYNSKYFITHNLATKYGIVNGSEVTLDSVISSDYKILNILDQNINEIVLEEMPICLLLKKMHSNENGCTFSNLDAEIIPLFPREERFTINPKCPELGTKSVEVKRIQFPLTPAYACTAYKAQGKTMSKVIIDLSQPPTGKIDSNYAYVALSRAKSIADILILRPFSILMLKKKHCEDYWLEHNRLFELSKSNKI